MCKTLHNRTIHGGSPGLTGSTGVTTSAIEAEEVFTKLDPIEHVEQGVECIHEDIGHELLTRLKG